MVGVAVVAFVGSPILGGSSSYVIQELKLCGADALVVKDPVALLMRRGGACLYPFTFLLP